MQRWAIFVDAGWLFAGGSTLAFGERRSRKELRWDPATLVDGIIDIAAAAIPDGFELLRVYWYDGAPQRLPIGDQIPLGRLPDVKLRLGRTSREGQKGVDGLIIHDLITHAYRGTLDHAVVVSGDEDLLDAIESAQANGTRVTLLEIPIGGISEDLIRAVDRLSVMPAGFFKDVFNLAGAADPAARTAPSTVPTEPETGRARTGTQADIKTGVESEADTRLDSDRDSSEETPPPPTIRPAWMDEPAPNQFADLVEMEEIGDGFATRWLADATDDEVEKLIAERPYLGNGLDALLLRTASEEHGWLEEGQRRALREGFWLRIAAWSPDD